ncbi:exported hypothetical protein [Gammaproteobacteria bacterium]
MPFFFRFHYCLALICVFAIGTNVAAEGLSHDPLEVVTDLEDMGYFDSPLPLSLADGNVVALLGNGSRGVAVWADGKVQALEEIPNKGRYPLLKQVGQDLYGIWWRKTRPAGDKFFYISTANQETKQFSPVVKVNREGQPLARYGFAADGEGSAVLVYLDERASRFHIYSARSRDRGVSWQQDQRMDRDEGEDGFKVIESMEPSIAHGKGRYVAVWKDRGQSQDGKPLFRILYSFSTNQGETWSVPKVVMTHPELFVTDDTLFFNQGRFLYLGFLGKEIVIFQSQEGDIWEKRDSLPVPVNSSLPSYALGKTLLHVAFVGGEGKPQVYYGSYDVNTGHWAVPAKRLDIKNFDFEGYQSNTPAVVELDNGVVAAIWEDYRHLRPSIYLNYSWDGGAHWQEVSRAVDSPGKARSVYPHVVALPDGRMEAWFSRFQSDGAPAPMRLLKKSVTFNKVEQKVVGLEPEPVYDEALRRHRLEGRVNAFWTGREQNKDEEVFNLYDPYFQARMNKHTFLGQGMSTIRYHGHHIESVKILGDLAKARVRMTYEIDQPALMGPEIKQPKTEQTLEMTWVWMDNEWFYRFESQGNAILRY